MSKDEEIKRVYAPKQIGHTHDKVKITLKESTAHQTNFVLIVLIKPNHLSGLPIPNKIAVFGIQTASS